MGTTLHSKRLIEAAQNSTGFTDFGGNSFREGLDILVSDINADSERPEQFVARNAGMITKILIDRLNVTNAIAQRPEVLNAPVPRSVGPVNGGAKVLAAALSLEQSGGYLHMLVQEMVKTVADWAGLEERDGRPLIEDATVLTRLAKAYVESRVSEALSARVLGTYFAGMQDLAYGPAAKIFSTESFIRCSTDLIDLAAPRSMLRGREGLGLVEKGYRHSTATTIYGGTTEVLLSMVAERRLGLPRSRAK